MPAVTQSRISCASIDKQRVAASLFVLEADLCKQATHSTYIHRLSDGSSIRSGNSVVIFSTVGISLRQKKSCTQDLSAHNVKLSNFMLSLLLSALHGRFHKVVVSLPPEKCEALTSSLTLNTVLSLTPSMSATNLLVSATLCSGSLLRQHV